MAGVIAIILVGLLWLVYILGHVSFEYVIVLLLGMLVLEVGGHE